ncbi:Copper amine oxidase 1, partial [Folsomia candida]
KNHPLDPLSPTEIALASKLIRSYFVSSHPVLYFSTVTLKEPAKSLLLNAFLDDATPPHFITRHAFANVMDPVTETGYEVVVDLTRKKVTSVVKLDPGTQPMYAIDEDPDINAVLLADPQVQLRLAAIGLTNLSMVAPLYWDFGYLGDRPEYLEKRVVQVFFSFQNVRNDNHYAHPLGFVAIVDILAKTMLAIEDLPTTLGFQPSSAPFGDTSAPFMMANYDPTLLPADSFRKNLRPTTVSQSGGPSYKVNGYQVEWQKWKFRVGFNSREGLVLHNINYNDKGHVRPLIYRAALSELFVAYGDPRPPFHRKMAFDAGQYGVGQSTHQIRPTADCKAGSIHFFDMTVSNKAGLPVTIPAAVCMYEDDIGPLMKKYNPRDRRAYVVRNQRLVISFTSGLGNYDYEWKWIFHLDASIRMEVNLHGIDNPTFVSNLGTDRPETPIHGTLLTHTPGILAQNHQHFFAVRIDTEIDGNENSVAMVDVVPDGPTGSPQNPYGNGFRAVNTLLKTSSQAHACANQERARSWHIYGNLSRLHPFSHTPMGYRLVAENPIYLMMQRDSPIHPKCGFVDHTVWVTPYAEDQLFAGGVYLNNSGLPAWVAAAPNASLVETDLVLWHVFGLTHIPRVEDFSVMSTESAGFWLKPVNFFLENPALDVPSFLHIQS